MYLKPMDRIELTERSLSCFGFGVASLLPILGIPMGLLAVAQFRNVALRRRGQWNPAEGYLRAGFVLAGLGLLASALLFGLAMLAILEYSSG